MRARCSLAAVLVLLATAAARAGGVAWYELGTPDVGTASAGRAALAMDASTAWGNPAGMAHLDGNQLMLGFQPSWSITKFEPKTGTTVSGTDGGDAGGFEPVITGFYTHKFEKLAIGVAVVPGPSQDLEFAESFVGRYFVERSSLRTVVLNPAIAFRASSYVSIGVGFDVAFGALDQTSAVNNGILDAGLGDGQIRFEQEGTGYGANLGVIVEPENGSRFGLTFRSPVTIGFSNGFSASGIGPNLAALLDSLGVSGAEIQKDVTLPQEGLLSLYQPIGEHAFVFSAGWQRWEEFGKTDLTIQDSTSTTVTRQRFLDDTYHLSGGLHWRLSEPWMLMAGYAYDTSASSSGKRTLDLPVDAQHRFAGGFQWSGDDQTTLSVSYLFANKGKAPLRETGILAGTVVGEFSTHSAHFLSVSLNRAW